MEKDNPLSEIIDKISGFFDKIIESIVFSILGSDIDSLIPLVCSMSGINKLEKLEKRSD